MTDACSRCGLDLRDSIHLRREETETTARVTDAQVIALCADLDALQAEARAKDEENRLLNAAASPCIQSKAVLRLLAALREREEEVARLTKQAARCSSSGLYVMADDGVEIRCSCGFKFVSSVSSRGKVPEHDRAVAPAIDAGPERA